MVEPKAEQNLALKVMRLTRPSFAFTPMILPFSHPSSIDATLTTNKPVYEEILDQSSCNSILSSTLTLPQSFGSIYLGETFVCYVSLHNDSTETCDHLNLRCDLQTASQRLPLLQPQASSDVNNEQIVPGESIDHVLSHEVKECGTHILVCEVSYNAPHRGKLNFRKYFKFQVAKPLDVKTKFYNAESDDVFLEAQVQNVTAGPLCLEKVGLEPSPMFRVMPLNHIPNSDTEGEEDQEEKRLVFGRVNYLQPQDSRQYLFCLTPRSDLKLTYKQLKGTTNIGKLDIIWRTNLGDRGRLQTSQLQRLAPNHGDIRFNVETVPSTVGLYKSFKMTCCIFNNSERTLDLELNLENVNKPRILWSGSCSRKLGLVEPSGSMDVVLEAVPQSTSLQSVSGIRITDSLLMRTYQFDDICHIYVVKDETMSG